MERDIKKGMLKGGFKVTPTVPPQQEPASTNVHGTEDSSSTPSTTTDECNMAEIQCERGRCYSHLHRLDQYLGQRSYGPNTGPYLSYMDNVYTSTCCMTTIPESSKYNKRCIATWPRACLTIFDIKLVKSAIDGPTPESPKSRPRPTDTDMPSYDEVMRDPAAYGMPITITLAAGPEDPNGSSSTSSDDGWPFFGSNWELERARDDERRYSGHYRPPPPCPMHHLGVARYDGFPGSHGHLGPPGLLGYDGPMRTIRTSWTPQRPWTARTTQRTGNPRASRTCRTSWTQRIHRSSCWRTTNQWPPCTSRKYYLRYLHPW